MRAGSSLPGHYACTAPHHEEEKDGDDDAIEFKGYVSMMTIDHDDEMMRMMRM